MNFDRSIDFTLKWEGGLISDPDDPGGETKFGISKRAYPLVDIVRLTVAKAKEIYSADYWDAMNCDEYEWPLCLVVFDTAVNLGLGRTRRLLGGLAPGSDKDRALGLIQAREAHYQRLATKKNFKKFLKGWLARTNDLRKVAGLL